MGAGLAIVAWARKWIGTSGYTEGSSHRFGQGVTRGDCSAFVNAAVHAATGHYIGSPDSWTGSQIDWLKAQGLWVNGAGALRGAQPGDCVYYSGHVALYEGGGNVISNGSDPVKEHSADYRPVLGIGRTSTLGGTATVTTDTSWAIVMEDAGNNTDNPAGLVAAAVKRGNSALSVQVPRADLGGAQARLVALGAIIHAYCYDPVKRAAIVAAAK